MSQSIDPKELKTLSDILALVLEDQPGQAASALEAIRTRAKRNAVTGGALKNLFVAIAPNPPRPAAAPRARAPRAGTGVAEMQAARTRIAQLTADINRLDLDLRSSTARIESLRSELNLTRQARAEAQQALLRVSTDSRPKKLLMVLCLICGTLLGIAGTSMFNAVMPPPKADNSRYLNQQQLLPMPESHPELITALRALLGEAGLLTGLSDTDPYCEDWRGLYHGRALAVIRPADTEAVSEAVRLCARHGVKLVPQGGNTSMVGGAAVSEDGSEIILNLSRLNRIRAVDPLDMTLSVEAGVTLKAAQDAAREAGCLLPLSIASEGSAQIGGVLATNAGGNNTVRYGNARELVLGIEAVLPEGRVFNGMRRLRKDNTGYSLRHLLVGSEGTLGIITAAVLQLAPLPRRIEVALCSLASPEAALELFTRVRGQDPSAIGAFEFMSGTSMGLVTALIEGAALPLAEAAPHYVLVELASVRDDDSLRALMEAVLGQAIEDGLVLDAAIAESGAQRAAIWKLREEHSEAQKRAGGSVKNDVSVPVSRIPELIRRAGEA